MTLRMPVQTAADKRPAGYGGLVSLLPIRLRRASSRKNWRPRVLTNNSEWARGGEEIWYSLFVSGDQSLRVIEAHSQSLTYRAPFSRALAVPLRALDHVPVVGAGAHLAERSKPALCI